MFIKTKPLEYTLYHCSSPLDAMKTAAKQERTTPPTPKGNRGTLFCRYIGFDSSQREYIEMLRDLDDTLRSLPVAYVKITEGLEKRFTPTLLATMKEVMATYSALEKEGDISFPQLHSIAMGTPLHNERLEWTKKRLFKETLELFDRAEHKKTESTRSNFGIKILMWMETYLGTLFPESHSTDSYSKLLYYGDMKKHEYYFLRMLSKLGCDILYVNPQQDALQQFPDIEKTTSLYRGRVQVREAIPFPKVRVAPKKETPKPPKEQRKRASNTTRRQSAQTTTRSHAPKASRNEKSFEELALIAESVVMIRVYNDMQQRIGTGSGVTITADGFIVTNFHVVRGGCYFGVLFENDQTEYISPRLTKYHSDNDLALIKIDRKTMPIAITDKPLVRGQQIVSIGSPMGLLNTISEGIVSGFRTLDSVDMVQITAPISPGSSGGALLDMFGNLTGITTAGFDGQNLNLAVPSKYIYDIAGNLL